MKKYGVIAKTRGGSIWGRMESWVHENGENLTFDSYDAAATAARKMNDNCGPVNRCADYYSKETEPESVHAQSPDNSMSMRWPL